MFIPGRVRVCRNHLSDQIAHSPLSFLSSCAMFLSVGGLSPLLPPSPLQPAMMPFERQKHSPLLLLLPTWVPFQAKVPSKAPQTLLFVFTPGGRNSPMDSRKSPETFKKFNSFRFTVINNLILDVNISAIYAGKPREIWNSFCPLSFFFRKMKKASQLQPSASWQ